MSAAAAIAVSILVSTGPVRLSSGDGALEIEVPPGYALRPAVPAAPGDFELADSSGNSLSLRRQPPEADRLSLEAAAYDRVKELELQLAAGQECAAGPFRDFPLRRGGAVRGLEGRCGTGPQAREYGVLISTGLGLALVGAASGPLAPLLEILEGARTSRPPSELSPPGPPAKGPLPPLPSRPFHGKFALILLAAFAAVQGAALAARALGLSRKAPPPPPAAPAETLFPVRIQRVHLQTQVVFEAAGANGEEWSGVSDRKASVVIGCGMGLFLLAGLQASFRADAGAVVETLVLSILTLGMGAFLQKSSPRALTLLDGDGHSVLQVVEDGFSPLDPRATAVDKEGWQLFRLRRRRAGRLRRWEVLDGVQETVLLEVEEKASYKTWLRPWTGHLWGLLRADYRLLAEGREVGSLDHEPTMENRARLSAAPLAGLAPRNLLAAVLFIERVDPDRWHPWPA